MRSDGPHLGICVEGLRQVRQYQATKVTVVGSRRPEMIARILDEELAEGDR
jgi:hypothetical protein